jgi:hypothetical protein
MANQGCSPEIESHVPRQRVEVKSTALQSNAHFRPKRAAANRLAAGACVVDWSVRLGPGELADARKLRVAINE